MERKLASIQRIANLEPIENADNLERATVLGWQLVVKKGDFRIGDLCVYFEVDSVLPIRPEFEFLRKNYYVQRLDGFRIRTIRLRGQVSQGLAFPIQNFKELTVWQEGLDVTSLLNVRKFEEEIPMELMSSVNAAFPSFIPKTDETRIQAVPNLLVRHKGKRFFVTEKVDGTSATFYLKDGVFGVCGRNYDFKYDEKNVYWQIAKKLDIEERLRFYGNNIAIQGEILGPKIQGNKYQLEDLIFRVYSVFDIAKYKFFDFVDFKYFCQYLKFESVPILEENWIMNNSVEDLVKYSTKESVLNPNCIVKREGVVFRPVIEDTDPEVGRLSFKVINPEFLIDNKE